MRRNPWPFIIVLIIFICGAMVVQAKPHDLPEAVPNHMTLDHVQRAVLHLDSTLPVTRGHIRMEHATILPDVRVLVYEYTYLPDITESQAEEARTRYKQTLIPSHCAPEFRPYVEALKEVRHIMKDNRGRTLFMAKMYVSDCPPLPKE